MEGYFPEQAHKDTPDLRNEPEVRLSERTDISHFSNPFKKIYVRQKDLHF